MPASGDTALVGYSSKPFLVTTDYAPLNGLSITPSSPGLIFTPSTLSLTPGSPFSSFTATLVSWSPAYGDSFLQVFTISYSVGGPDANWYQLASLNTIYLVSQGNIISLLNHTIF